jgi:uncharacterized protein (TIGR01777 family)
MNVLITGGTGFIGRALAQHLTRQGHAVTVLSRNPDKVAAICGPGVAALGDLKQLKAEDAYQVIINLAGEPIFDARWTEARKKLIRDSRINLTGQLIDGIERMAVKPDVLISGSAIGYYGDQGDTVLTEQSAPNPDFSHRLCADWEQAAQKSRTVRRQGLPDQDRPGYRGRRRPAETPVAAVPPGIGRPPGQRPAMDVLDTPRGLDCDSPDHDHRHLHARRL